MGKALIPVDGYVRVSRVAGREGDSFLSPELQRASIERVCKSEGLRVVRWYEELDASGGDSERPQWNEAIARVEQGKTRGVVCWNLARFSRSTQDALRAIERVEQAGGRLYSEEGQLDKLSRTIRFAIAEDERDRATASFRAAVSNAISRGIYVSAKVPFGYTRDPETRKLVPDPERAPIVVELFEQRATRRSWFQLCAWARETHGLHFAKTTVSWMVSNPAYLGHARSGDAVNVRAHEPIVSQLLWDRAQAVKGERPIHKGSPSTGILLRSLVRCATCGHTLLVGSSKSGKDATGTRRKIPVYACRYEHCDARAAISAERLDEYVVGLVLDFLRKGKVKTGSSNAAELALAERDHEEASHALRVFKANRKAITTLGVEAWNELLEEYVVAEAVARETVEALRAEDSFETWIKVPDLWAEWTDESRREFLSKVVREVVLVPAHRKPIPVEDRASIRLHGADVEDRWLLTLAGTREARIAQIDAALADHDEPATA